ncbi:hypothetical protein HF526_19495 [Pseudonocardia sp. K10HN5]|uniref:OsmC family protein n=1 Tax=Pseudonocardia acidicola TaxID=2724939 RepID=A0ABX1SF11_9PSEU|nr:OsmC family protein [Pseudonocardia acidicola]NMH99482.1 hypothetical protein [Pseudonocardia acidicola]
MPSGSRTSSPRSRTLGCTTTTSASAPTTSTGSSAERRSRVDTRSTRSGSPEQLFAAGCAACFHSAMRFALAQLGLSRDALRDSHVTARVHFLEEEPSDFQLAVELDFRAPRLQPDQARAVMERTHTICPYSKATAARMITGQTIVRDGGGYLRRPTRAPGAQDDRAGRRLSYRARPAAVFDAGTK